MYVNQLWEINPGRKPTVQRLRQALNSFTKMQLYNYQDFIYQYIIYARKKIDIFMKYLYSNSFTRLDSFYD